MSRLTNNSLNHSQHASGSWLFGSDIFCMELGIHWAGILHCVSLGFKVLGIFKRPSKRFWGIERVHFHLHMHPHNVRERAS